MKSNWKYWMVFLACAAWMSGVAHAQSPELDADAGSVRINGGTVETEAGQAVYDPYQMLWNGGAPGNVTVDPHFRAAAGISPPTRSELERTQWRLYVSGLDTAGVPGSWTNLHAFIPVRAFGEYNFFAVNPRLLLNDNGDVGANFGFIHRFYVPSLDRMFGNSLWYDYDATTQSDYHRIGWMFESRGRYVSYRAGINYVLEDAQRVYQTVPGNLAFVSNSLVRLVTENFAAPVDEYTVGATWSVPVLGKYGVDFGVDLYYLAASGVEDSLGTALRTEMQVTEDLRIQALVTNDKMFNTNLSINFELTLPDGAPSRILRPNPVVMSLTRSVPRNYRVRTAFASRVKTVEERRTKDNRAFRIAHIDPNRPTNGDGSWENPYNSVAGFMSDPGRTIFDIIFVQPNADGSSTNLDTGITITSNQRLLGNGMRLNGTPHLFTSTNGTFILPGQTSGPNPVLSNINAAGAMPAVVTLGGDATEISGFTIDAQNGGLGITNSGASIDGFNINNNTFNNVLVAAQITSDTSTLLNCPGEDVAIFADNVVNGAGFGATRGLDLTHIAGTVGLRVTDNTVMGILGEDRDGDGVIDPSEDLNMNGVLDPGEDLNNNGILDLSEDVNGNMMLDGGIAINIDVTGGSVVGDPLSSTTAPFGIGRNNLSQNDNGLQYIGRTGSTSLLDVQDNITNNNAGYGMSFDARGGTITFSNFLNNESMLNGLDGIQWMANAGGTLTTMTPALMNNASGNRRHGLSIVGDGGSTLAFQIGDPNDADPNTFDNMFNDNGTAMMGGDGISILLDNGSTVLSTTMTPSGIYNAEILRNQGNGITIDLINGMPPGATGTIFDNFQIIATTSSNNAGDGLLVSGDSLNANGNTMPGPGLNNLLIVGNNFSQNTLNGINFQLLDTNLVNHVIQGNTLNMNGATGSGPGTGPSDFDIEVVFGGGLTPSQQAVFALAAARWEQIIIGDVPDVGTIDDVQIAASGVAIDGVGGILGQAGPTGLRTGSSIPFQGVMQFDTADLANLESSGQLQDVILHEMAHVLGVGTIWNNLGLLTGAGGSDPRFTGPMATAEYNTRFSNTDPDVPVENTGGPGTADSHWRESVFNNELLTGFLNTGPNPISRISVGQFEDLGYTVNYNAADPYLSAANTATTLNLETSFIHNASLVFPTTFTSLVTVQPNVMGNGINYSLGSAASGSAVVNGIVENNAVISNGNNGIQMIDPQFGGVASDIDFLNNQINTNGADAVNISLDGSNSLEAVFRFNNIANNTGGGVIVSARDTSMFSTRTLDPTTMTPISGFTANVITGNGAEGAHFSGTGSAVFDLIIGGPTTSEGNTFLGNGDANLAVSLAGASNVPGTFLIQNNVFNNAVDGADIDLFGAGVLLRGTDTSFFRDVMFLDNFASGNASGGLRVEMQASTELHAAMMPATPGLTVQRNTFSLNQNGIEILRNGDAVIRALIGDLADPANGNTVDGNRNHGLLIETDGGDAMGAIGTFVTAANNSFSNNNQAATGGDGVHIETFGVSSTNVNLVNNTIDGMGVQDNGVEVTTNATSFFGGLPLTTPALFDGNIVINHARAGYEFNQNDLSTQVIDVFGNSQQALISGNQDGIVINSVGSTLGLVASGQTIRIGDPASVTSPGTPGADATPNVLITQNTRDGIQINKSGAGTQSVTVTNVLAMGDRSTTNTSRNGIGFNFDQLAPTDGTVTITVDESTFTDFGGDGLHVFYDDGGTPTTLTLTATDSIFGADQFSFNGGDGIDINVQDNGASFTFSNIVANGNGGDGFRITTLAENVDGRSIPVPDPMNGTNDIVLPTNPTLLATPGYVVPWGDSLTIDITTFLSITGSTFNFNGDNGVDFAVGAATSLGTAGTPVEFQGNTTNANAVSDFFTRTIDNNMASVTLSTNGTDGNTDIVVLDTMAHLWLNWGNAMPNVGNQLVPTNLGGMINSAGTDPFKGASRTILTNFNAVAPSSNLFSLFGTPVDENRVFRDGYLNPPFGLTPIPNIGTVTP